jgi:predicted chitinase
MKSEYLLSRKANYGLLRERLLDLLVQSPTPGERRALQVVYALSLFVQGRRKLPGKGELQEICNQILGENLGFEEFSRRWKLNLEADLAIDDPETYYLETLEILRRIQELRAGWEGYIDGK